MRCIVVTVLLLLISASTLAAPPSGIPKIDLNQAVVSMVVGTSVPGDYLPVPKECQEPNVICLRYPLWFTVTPILPVYGYPPKGQIVVSTYSHYGQPEKDDASSPRLILLFSQADQAVMPVNASARLVHRKDGEYFFIIYWENPLPWLPCGVSQARESILARDFPNSIDRPRDDYDVEQAPGLFRYHGKTASPRYGISMTRLRQYLEKHHPLAADFHCAVPEHES